VMIVELLAYAHTLTGDRKYVEAGLPSVEDWMENGLRAPIGYVKREMTNGLYLEPKPSPPNTKTFGVCAPAMLGFVAAAKSDELVRSLDYRLRA